MLFPTTFPCRDTPFSPLNCVSRTVFLSSGHVSCRDTPFSSQKSVSRAELGRFVVSLRRAGVFLMPRHTLFGMKLCIASSFPVIWPCFVQRHTFSRTKVCIASRFGTVCSIVEACRRLPHAATNPFRHETVYRGQFSCHLAVFRAATHIFPLNSLYRGRG